MRCWEIDGSDLFPYANMIWMLALQGDLAGSREWVNRARLRFAKNLAVERAEIASLCVAGRFEAALERHGGPEPHGHPIANVSLAVATLRLGHAERARRLFEPGEGFARMDMDAAGWAAAFISGIRERVAGYRRDLLWPPQGP